MYFLIQYYSPIYIYVFQMFSYPKFLNNVFIYAYYVSVYIPEVPDLNLGSVISFNA